MGLGSVGLQSKRCIVSARSTFDPRAMSGRVLRDRTHHAQFRTVIRGAARGRAMETDGRS